MQQQTRDAEQLNNISRGGYILKDCDGTPDCILIATGSEVDLAVAAHEQLAAKGMNVRVVSMPSTDVFDEQDAEYREHVLPSAVRKRVAVEAGIADYWRKYVGLDGTVIGMNSFGESAPAKALFEHFDITVEAVVRAAS
tara:strand:- start:996 stop:1412 length:417 start_codon:yes stop_codon:yes gene_type:complete